MNIKELRQTLSMSQSQFSSFFGIPIGTLRNWEQGINSPPDYVYRMLFASIRRNAMINLETLKFLKILEDLSERTENGIEDFYKTAQTHTEDKIYYDSMNETCEKGRRIFPAVNDFIESNEDCDIISRYGDEETDYIINVVFEENTTPSIEVKLLGYDDVIVVENGRWYFG